MVCGVVVVWFVVLWFLRKIRPTQLWAELSWVVAKIKLGFTNLGPLKQTYLIALQYKVITNGSNLQQGQNCHFRFPGQAVLQTLKLNKQ